MIDLYLYLEESVFVNTFFFSASSNNQMDAAYMNIKSTSPSRISLKNLIVITQVSYWNAIKIHNSKDCLLTLYFLFSHFGNNRAASMGIKRASAHRKNHHPFFKFSTWIIIIILYCCGIYDCVSLPVGCHAFVSPMLACFAERRVLCAP
jgi:hypothetical protein